MMKKRIFSLFTALALCLTLLPAAARAEESDLPVTEDATWSGNGTEESPYQINTIDELKALATKVNNGTNYSGTYFTLTADVTLNEKVLNEDGTLNGDGSGPEAWEPIGYHDSSRTYGFAGIFDGNNHTVSGLYINNTSKTYVALFGWIERGGTVKNVTVADSYFSGKQSVGAICGDNYGTIENCHNKGTAVNGDIQYVGGVCAFNGYTVSGCTNSGPVSGGSSTTGEGGIGGVVGHIADSQKVENSTNYGKVTGNTGVHGGVGGVCGNSDRGTIKNCRNEGEVNGDSMVGGVCGRGYGNSIYEGSTIQGCENTGIVTGNDMVGGVCGNIGSGKKEDCTNQGAVAITAGGVTTTITPPPSGGDITINAFTPATLPSGSTVQTGTGPEITVNGDDVTVDNDGIITVPAGGGTLTVKDDAGKATIITPPANGTVKPSSDGKVEVPSGTTVQTEDGPKITVPANSSVKPNGSVTVPDGGSVTVQDESGKTTTITPPNGGTVAPGPDGTVIVPAGSTVKTDDGSTEEVPEGGGAVSPSGEVKNIVTFNTQGGSDIPSQAVDKGSTAAKPADPNKDGYNFGGWYTDETFKIRYNFNTVLTGNITLYAKWTVKSGGGGGGIYIPTTYPPTVEVPGGGGTVTVSPSRPITGQKVTVKPKPDTGYEVDKVTVTDKDGKPVPVTQNPNGTYTFTQPVGKVKIEVSFKAPWEDPYTDVSETAWYFDAVRYVSENGLMKGYGGGRFGPDDDLSRAQLVQILYNHAGQPDPSGESSFTDVTGGAWYTDAVTWAAESGIVGGYGGGQFGPDDSITREQLTVMMYRYAGSPAPPNLILDFTDAGEASGYALDALRWAVANGIINGEGGGKLDPGGLATRAQTAAMLMRYLEGTQE